ncbi:hypothetical protein LJC08_00805 [Methanimicrococcus sp. OttesenSCG-928-J09]|nr:hypothetical protein [Methanimicrococcus sp. OttesenSCG-928-J09]
MSVEIKDFYQPYLREFSLNTGQNFILFHGTACENTKPIIKGGFLPSQDDDTLYLGNGVYFYDCEYLAIKWRWGREHQPEIVKDAIRKKSRGHNLNSRELDDLIECFNDKHAVIISEFESVNYLDMDNVKNKKIFETIYRLFYRSTKNVDISDTTIYNILFEELGLKDIYDMVTLTLNVYRIKKDSILPQHNIPNKIYCIKNEKFIVNRCKCEITKEHIDDYLRIVTREK